jgi:dethiobiotin synthetase
MRGLLVTGTDTGVGKTILSAALLAAMIAAGERVRPFKPVVTGVDDPAGSWPADHVLLAQIAGMTPEQVAPLRYGPALSPQLAAQLAGERIDPGRLLAELRDSLDLQQRSTYEPTAARPATQASSSSRSRADAVIVEGVGGLLVPFTDSYTVCDFAVALDLPVLIAARPGLGTINHTLLTLRVARAAGLDVRAVVMTPWPPAPSELERSNRETIERIGEVEVATLAEVPSPATGDLATAGARLPWRSWIAAAL